MHKEQLPFLPKDVSEGAPLCHECYKVVHNRQKVFIPRNVQPSTSIIHTFTSRSLFPSHQEAATSLQPLPSSPSSVKSDEAIAAAVLRSRFSTCGPVPIATLHPPAKKPLTVALLPTPTKGSADVKERTVQKRSELMEDALEKVAVPADASPTEAKQHLRTQLTSLVKRRKSEYTTAMAAVTGVQPGRRLTEQDMLELKKYTG